jgi:alpha-tubulin suppressor-like RCC1 family protein
VTQIAAGWSHTCALLSDGTVRCWGDGEYGKLGYGNTDSIGDDEAPATAGPVDVGGVVTQISAGDMHTCVLLEGGTVRCWGLGNGGRLGYGNTDEIGDDEAPASAGDVDVGGVVTQIAAGGNLTCALLEGGTVRCWGWIHWNLTIGDDETPASEGDLDVGGVVTQIATGFWHTCAVLEGGAIKCWGYNGDFMVQDGRLGYGISSMGNWFDPADMGEVDVGGVVDQITAGVRHTCARLDSDQVRCWGAGANGRLGYGNLANIGDDELPAVAGDVDAGGTVLQVSAGHGHTCVLLEGGAVRCWGYSRNGQLGYGSVEFCG